MPVVPNRLENHLRIEHRVTAGPDQSAGLTGRVDGRCDHGVVVERPDPAVDPEVGRGFGHHPQMGRRTGEAPGGLESGRRITIRRLQQARDLAAVQRPCCQIVDDGREPCRGEGPGVDVQQFGGGSVDGGEIGARVHQDHADVQFIEEVPEERELAVGHRFAGGARQQHAQASLGLVAHVALLPNQGKRAGRRSA